MFICNKNGFVSCNEPLREAARGRKIDILVADSNYGVNKHPWDDKPWDDEFGQAFNFVENHNGVLKGTNFIFFLSDQQFLSCISAIKNYGMSYIVLTWSKGDSNVWSVGSKFRQTTEHIIVAWKGVPANFVNNWTPEDVDRYNTLLNFDRQRKWLRDDKGSIVNKYQKPVRLMDRLLKMAGKKGDTFIVDITCGTGTTAVSAHSIVHTVLPTNILLHEKCLEFAVSILKLKCFHDCRLQQPWDGRIPKKYMFV